MANSWNPNEDYRRSTMGSSRFLLQQRSMSEQNHLVNNATAAESEQMRRQHSAGNIDFHGVAHHSIATGTVPMWQQQSSLCQHTDTSSADSHSRIYGINMNAAETGLMRQQQSGQCQYEDVYSADSHSRRKIPAIAEEDRRPRKREADRAHMGIVKEDREALQAEIGQLRSENESLRRENDWLRRQVDDLKKMYEDQHASNQTMEIENRRLKDKYIELLEKSNPLVDPRFGNLSNELGHQRVPLTNLSRVSACGSVTGSPANPF